MLTGYIQTSESLQGLPKCRLPGELGCEHCFLWAVFERAFSKAQLAAGLKLRDGESVGKKLCEYEFYFLSEKGRLFPEKSEVSVAWLNGNVNCSIWYAC